MFELFCNRKIKIICFYKIYIFVNLARSQNNFTDDVEIIFQIVIFDNNNNTIILP